MKLLKLFLLSSFLSTSLMAADGGGGGSKPEQPALHSSPNLSEWIGRCLQATSNFALANDGRIDYSKATALISEDPIGISNTMTALLNAYKERMVTQYSQREFWLPKEDQWKKDLDVFQPVAERLVLEEDARVFTFGDFHGDILSFAHFLQDLKKAGVIGEDFKLKPKCYLVFLGDYTDRGAYGLEVIYTVLRLLEANPKQVRAIRGNHEDEAVCSRYGFYDELETKLKAKFSWGDPDFLKKYGSFEQAIEFLRIRDKLKEGLKEFYELMPVVIYLGRGDDWIQACHGGLEHGYSPDNLLSSANESVHFDLVNPLDRSAFIASLSSERLKLEFGTNYLEGCYDKAHQWTEPFSLASPQGVVRAEKPQGKFEYSFVGYLGFMWADFQYNRHDSVRYDKGRGSYTHSCESTSAFLPKLSPMLRAVIRAHQHGPGPIMKHLETHGLFRFWKEDDATQQELPVQQNDVFMFNVGADSVYWHHLQFKIATYGELRMAPTFSDWRMVKHSVLVNELSFEQQIKEDVAVKADPVELRQKPVKEKKSKSKPAVRVAKLKEPAVKPKNNRKISTFFKVGVVALPVAIALVVKVFF